MSTIKLGDWEELYPCQCGAVYPSGAIWLHGDLCKECGERVTRKVVGRRNIVVKTTWGGLFSEVLEHIFEINGGEARAYNPNLGMRYWPG